MDKNSAFIMQDLTDIVERLTTIVRTLDPGQDYSFIEFLIARIDRVLEERLEKSE